MGVSKTEQFTDSQNEMSVLFKAISHPARIAIIEYLLSVDSCICSDIVNHLPLAQATVSQHLKELKNAKIIQGSIEGTSICYCLNAETLSKFGKYFNVLENKLEIKCC